MANEKKQRKPRQPAPKDETPAQRFTRLATMRTNKAIKAIAGLSKLSGHWYERTDAQTGKIIAALRDEVAKVERAFAGKSGQGGGFSL